MALAQEQHLADTWQTGGLKPRACDCGGTVFTILHQRVMADMRRRQFLGGTAAMLAPFIGLGLSTGNAIAQQPKTSERPLL
ncbi:amidohydrolase family protein, partial [Gemella palaticanis]|nr:amidohydrolase family protein [Gemella palaticanis]NYS48195.1 amidohydrolase family protein [Gemella palaticanis]